jgi:hypothetical protein
MSLPSTSYHFLQSPVTSFNLLSLPSTSYHFLQPTVTSFSLLSLPSTSCHFLQPPVTSSNPLSFPPTSCSFLLLPPPPSTSCHFLQPPVTSFNLLSLPSTYCHVVTLFLDISRDLDFKPEDHCVTPPIDQTASGKVHINIMTMVTWPPIWNGSLTPWPGWEIEHFYFGNNFFF